MRPGVNYNSISRGVHLLADGGLPASFDGMLWRPASVAAYGAALHAIYSFALGHAQIQNRTGATIVCGIGARVHTSMWRAGQWVHATTTYNDDTVDAQDAGADDFPLETLTNNDGFLVASRYPINCIVKAITEASLGSTPIRVIEYSKAGGTWGTIANAFIPIVSNGHYAEGETVVLWDHPTDLAVLEAGHGTGVPIGMYGYRFRATTAPTTTAGLAGTMSVFEVIRAIEGLGDNNLYEINPASSEHKFAPHGEALFAILSSKSAIQSRVSAEVRAA